jgi:uncharacterized protein
VKIVVAGGTGFLGRPLVAALRGRGDDVIVLTRRPGADGEIAWMPEQPSGGWVAAVQAADAVINLAGEGIADRRWSPARKAAILNSRVAATRALAHVLGDAVTPPAFLSGSAIGIYGDRGDEHVTERTPPGSDFLARVCVEWEREANAVANVARVVLLRTGVVLSRDGGALAQMSLPFRFFAGGRIGSGRQFISWIHRDDWIAMVVWALQAAIAGPLNLTAPTPVRNADFARALGRVLHRPALMPAPTLAVRLAVGELADAAILGGQRVLPTVAMERGFAFQHPELEDALRAIYGAP